MSNPNGPQSGSTPADDGDLHTSSNPYAQGSPPMDLSQPSTYQVLPGGVPGYYQNPPAAAGNPHSQGAAGWVPEGVDFGSLYADAMRNRVAGGDAAQPSAGDYYDDGGFGRDGESRS